MTLVRPHAMEVPTVGTPCVLWTGAKTMAGYPVKWLGGGKRAYAHRVACEEAHGPIPDGWQVDHLCRTTLCVNPDHLEAVPPRTNSLRSRSVSGENARKERCKRGHDFDRDNTYIDPRGLRQCRACRALKQREYMDRKRAA